MTREAAMRKLWERLTASSPFFLMAGPNVLQTRDHALRIAERVAAVKEATGVEIVFKASFDKANRTSARSYRGPGLEEGMRILSEVKRQTHLPIVTDIHETHQAETVAEVADVIQIPAFLCRQTDLLVAAAATNRIIHIKKGQFASTDVIVQAANKVKAAGNEHVLLGERGTMFGYNDLVVDPRNLINMRASGFPVVMDVTHCLQKPSARSSDMEGEIVSDGEARMIPDMGMMACSLGVNGLFIEVDDDPASAPCDGKLQWSLEKFLPVVQQWKRIAEVRRQIDAEAD